MELTHPPIDMRKPPIGISPQPMTKIYYALGEIKFQMYFLEAMTSMFSISMLYISPKKHAFVNYSFR